MISTEFAPNETWEDAWTAFKLLWQPWRWQKGTEGEKVTRRLKNNFFTRNDQFYFFFSARGALYYLLKLLQLPSQSQVLVQSFTCAAVVLPILELKLTPVYIDINQDDYSMSLADLKSKISPQAKVLILQHTFAITPIQRQKILDIAKQHNLIVIEDLAQGFDEKNFVNGNDSTIKLLSFGRSKAFSSVFGGAVVTQDAVLTRRLKALEKQLSFPSYLTILSLLCYKIIAPIIKTTHDISVGKFIHLLTRWMWNNEISQQEKQGLFDHRYAKAYPNGLATLLLPQLNRYKATSKQRRLACEEYQRYFTSKNIHGPLIRFPIQIDQRNYIRRYMDHHNIITGVWYDQVIAPKGINMNKLHYQKGTCPTAEKITERILNLPTNISPQQAKYVLTALKEAIEKL